MAGNAPGDYERIRAALGQAGVSGAQDFGYFVNRPDLFRPSELDERAAMPVLLQLLPTLTEPKAAGAVAAHLRRPWARGVAFASLVKAFRRWAPIDGSAGWALGDSLASAATPADLDVLLALIDDHAFGKARQMIVYSVWRFRKDPRVAQMLIRLVNDPDVCLHAMSSLRRSVGNEVAFSVLQQVSEQTSDPYVRAQAVKAARKAKQAIERNQVP